MTSRSTPRPAPSLRVARATDASAAAPGTDPPPASTSEGRNAVLIGALGLAAVLLLALFPAALALHPEPDRGRAERDGLAVARLHRLDRADLVAARPRREQ